MAEKKGASSGRLKASADLKASQSNVAQQAKLLENAGTAWHAVKYGNLEVISDAMRLHGKTAHADGSSPL